MSVRHLSKTYVIRKAESFVESLLGGGRTRTVRAVNDVSFEVRRGALRLDEIVAPVGIVSGFECSAVLINAQRFTKTANIWGVENNRLGTNSNRIVLFRKP